jgi:hypothetical protein
MKMSKEHFNALSKLIQNTMTAAGPDTLKEHKAMIAKDPRVKDINTRYRWDMFWAISQKERTAWNDMVGRNSEGNSIYNTDHMNTALKKIVGC